MNAVSDKFISFEMFFNMSSLSSYMVDKHDQQIKVSSVQLQVITVIFQRTVFRSSNHFGKTQQMSNKTSHLNFHF